MTRQVMRLDHWAREIRPRRRPFLTFLPLAPAPARSGSDDPMSRLIRLICVSRGVLRGVSLVCVGRKMPPHPLYFGSTTMALRYPAPFLRWPDAQPLVLALLHSRPKALQSVVVIWQMDYRPARGLG